MASSDSIPRSLPELSFKLVSTLFTFLLKVRSVNCSGAYFTSAMINYSPLIVGTCGDSTIFKR